VSTVLIHYVDGESTAVGPQSSSPDKEEEKEIKQHKPEPVEPRRIPSSRASEKRNFPVKEEKQTDSESEQLRLPAIRPQSESSSGKSPYLSSVKVVTPKGKLCGHIAILTKQNQLTNRTRTCGNSSLLKRFCLKYASPK